LTGRNYDSAFSRCFPRFPSHPYGDHRDLHPFPTRRSSDLGPMPGGRPIGPIGSPRSATRSSTSSSSRWRSSGSASSSHVRGAARSEEHTSELQSRENLVCRLLLEKKKNTARWTAAWHARRP